MNAQGLRYGLMSLTVNKTPSLSSLSSSDTWSRVLGVSIMEWVTDKGAR